MKKIIFSNVIWGLIFIGVSLFVQLQDCNADTYSFSGRVYEGETGQEPPNSNPIEGVTVQLYCSNNQAEKGLLLTDTTTDSSGYYELTTTNICEYYNIIEVDLPGYTSNGATTVYGNCITANWISFALDPSWDSSENFTDNKFWDNGSTTGDGSYPIDTPAEIITQLYVGYFNRVPDCVGLSYWMSDYASGRSLLDMAHDFAASPEAHALYPYLAGTSTDPGNFITNIYQNLFNRVPDTAGYNYWLNQLSSGALTAPDMIITVINGALAPTGDPSDATTIQNKVHDALVASGCPVIY